MALRTSLVAQPHLYMGDTQGRPLDAGKVYFGQPNKDPELYPINVFYDEALTIAAPQPIRTMGGFMNANGQMVEIYAAETEYSVKVLDAYGRQVFYQESMSSENAQLAAQKLDTGITATAKFGGIERNLSEKLISILDVRDFGRIDIDAHLAIQKAVDYAATKVSGTEDYPQATAVVSLSAGTYNIPSGGTVQLYKGVKIVGAGQSSTIINHGGGGVPCFTTDPNSSKNTNIKLSGFTIEGSGEGTTQGIKMNNNYRNGVIKEVTIRNCNINLDTVDCWTLVVEKCDFQGAVLHNIKSLNPTQATFSMCRIDGSGGHNVYISQSDSNPAVNPIFFSCAIQRSNKAGIYAIDMDLFTINCCYFEGNNRLSMGYADIEWVQSEGSNRGTNMEVYGSYGTTTTGGTNGKFINADTSGTVTVMSTRTYNNTATDKLYEVGVNLGSRIKKCTLVGTRIVGTTRVVRSSLVTGLRDDENDLISLAGDSSGVKYTALGNLYCYFDAPSNREAELRFQSDGVTQWFVGRGDSDYAHAGHFFISSTGGGLKPAFQIKPDGSTVVIGEWQSPFIIGRLRLWSSAAGKLMYKANSNPISESDGTVL